LEVVAPGAKHQICCRHLYVNYRDVGHRGLALKDKLWARLPLTQRLSGLEKWRN